MEKSDHSVTLIDLCGEERESSATINDFAPLLNLKYSATYADRHGLHIFNVLTK